MEKYETKISLTFKEPGQGTTQVLVTHDGYRSEEDRDRHREGWPRFLEHFARYCEAVSKAKAGLSVDFWADDVRLSRYTVEKYKEDTNENP